MLVVISDLHFEEEQSDNIPGANNISGVKYSRNLPGRAYQRFIAHLANEARRNEAERLDLVLAGDVFDLHRTAMWFYQNPKNLRPYVNINKVDSRLESLILAILKAIQDEDPVAEALEAFRLLAKGKYWDDGTKNFPVPTHIYLIPGNHDRLLNSTEAVKREVRNMLGIPMSRDPLPHVLTFPNEGAIVRHGHEYDKYNFSTDISRYPSIPHHLPDETYDDPPFGDFATIDIASQAPYLFRRHHGDDQILADPVLRQVYTRLLEFDDLRPQRAILNYLLNMPMKNIDQIEVWKAIEPIIKIILEKIHDNPFFISWLDKMDKKWQLDEIDILQTALSLKSWRLAGIPLGIAKFTSNALLGSDIISADVVGMASKEEVIQQGEFKYIVAGHTHRPAAELIASDELGERYYIDTGTWRNRVPATPDFKAFGRLKQMTYVIIYGPNEDPGRERAREKGSSVDFWSGITQRWRRKDEG